MRPRSPAISLRRSTGPAARDWILAAARRAGICLWSAPWSYYSIGIAAICIVLASMVAVGSAGRFARYLPMLGMALAIGDAARSPDRRVHAAIGFCLNVLALLAWAVASVLLHALISPVEEGHV